MPEDFEDLEEYYYLGAYDCGCCSCCGCLCYDEEEFEDWEYED